MPHVSRIKMNPKVSEKISSRFFAVLTKAKKEKDLVEILNELLTKTEKIMLAKRVAIALFLDKDIPQHKIVDILKVSYTTVAKISLAIESGKYKNILKISKQEKIDLEKLVWGILTVGGLAPPMVGRKYWRENIKNK